MEVVETDAEGERFHTIPEVARILRVSDQSVRRWIKAGELLATKPGKEYRIRQTDLEEFLKDREAAPKAPGRSSFEPSFNDVLKEEERHAPALRILTALIDDLLADGWEERIAKRGQAAEPSLDWAVEVDRTATVITARASEQLELAFGVSTSPEALDLFRALQRLDEVVSQVSSWSDAPADFEAHKRQRGVRLRALRAIA